MLKLDHFAIAAETLETGRAYAEDVLGMALRPGGQHPHYGTHNMLLGLADGLYMEVIAIDPEAPKPAYPRWFDLDRFKGRARPTNWICQTDDLAGFVAEVPEAGVPVPLQRGDLRWAMAVPPSGVLPFDNLFPPVIEWAGDDHPSERLEGSGVSLKAITVIHPEADALKDRLTAHLHDPRVRYETGSAALVVEVITPHGGAVFE